MNQDEERARARAKEIAPIAAAFGEGKKVEVLIGGTWFKTPFPLWNGDDRMRIAPEPKLRPFRSDEIQPGWLIRNKAWPNVRWIITGVDNENIAFGKMVNTFEIALMEKEYSTDGGATWKPFGVVE